MVNKLNTVTEQFLTLHYFSSRLTIGHKVLTLRGLSSWCTYQELQWSQRLFAKVLKLNSGLIFNLYLSCFGCIKI